MHRKTLGSIGILLLAMACSGDSPTAPEPAPLPPGLIPSDPSLTFGFGLEVLVAGAGIVDFDPAGDFGDGKFHLLAIRWNGSAFGTFRQTRNRATGLVDFEGRVTCVTVDPNLPGRARVGGIVTRNRSTDPAFLTENHQVGDDVWFRVDDSGHGTANKKSTTYGFKPTLVNTSAEYCALPFADGPLWNPASIFPLAQGTIQVKQ